MQRVFVLLFLSLFLLVLFSCSSGTRGPKGLSRETYAATEKAVAAIQRANECRDDGLLIFEQRFLEAEKAVDNAIATGKNPHDTMVGIHMHNWVESMKLYRHIMDRYVSAMADPDLKRRVPVWSRMRLETAANSDKCLASVQSFL
jgi:hypothetical protein